MKIKCLIGVSPLTVLFGLAAGVYGQSQDADVPKPPCGNAEPGKGAHFIHGNWRYGRRWRSNEESVHKSRRQGS